MPLFNRNPYPGAYGAPMRRRSGLKTLLLILGIVFGLYLKYFNVVTGILLIILGLTAMVRPRQY